MRTFILLTLAVLLSGCAAHGPIGSFAGPLPQKPAVVAIADDAAIILAGLYPPGHTTLHVLPARDNGFALIFENALRARGFTLAATDAGAVSVAYILDRLEENTSWYLHLRLSDGRVIARCYLANGQPEGGKSQMLLEPRTAMPIFNDMARVEP